MFGILLLCGFLWFVCLKHAKQNKYCILYNNSYNNYYCIILYITIYNCVAVEVWVEKHAYMNIHSTLAIFTSSRVGVVL